MDLPGRLQESQAVVTIDRLAHRLCLDQGGNGALKVPQSPTRSVTLPWNVEVGNSRDDRQGWLDDNVRRGDIGDADAPVAQAR